MIYKYIYKDMHWTGRTPLVLSIMERAKKHIDGECFGGSGSACSKGQQRLGTAEAPSGPVLRVCDSTLLGPS